LNRGVNQIGLLKVEREELRGYLLRNGTLAKYRTMMIYEKQKIPAMYRLGYHMNKLEKIII